MNRWSRRFTSLEQIDVIRARARLQPRPLTYLDTLRPGVAAAKLREALLATYFPTHQAGKVMQSIIGAGREHCVVNYSTDSAFAEVAHGSEVPAVEIEPILVTGLAGVGKTKLLEALARVLPEDSNFKTGKRATCFPLQAHWRLKLESSQSLSTTLTKIAEQAQPGIDVPRGNDARVEQLRRLAYRNGLALLMLDEVQFRTHSNATAAIADLFHRLRIVAPFVLAANFSLVRNLLNSNQQDRDRILAESIESKRPVTTPFRSRHA